MDETLYRPCVGLAILNEDGRVFVGQRFDAVVEAWQMPQGGIDPGETPIEAAYRELFEETGLKPDHVALLKELPDWLFYDLPVELQGTLWGGRYKGQRQKWFVFRLMARDAAINIAHDKTPEFCAWQWLTPNELPDHIVPFKRDLYARVVRAIVEEV
jgi:putative (di)nucleoside polyphosphate hydrolase